MASLLLSPLEARILGCLLEKERLTPENYPLSLNSLTAACNQSTNRDPISNYDERSVDAGLTSLREQKLAILIHSAGARVQKYRHNLPEHYTLEPRDVGVLCVLLLRGPQTPGELRARTERFFSFPSLESLEATLHGLMQGAEPLVRLLPPRPGQKERRYVQLLTGEPGEDVLAGGPPPATAAPSITPTRLEALEQEVAALRQDLLALQEELRSFRKQFE